MLFSFLLQRKKAGNIIKLKSGEVEKEQKTVVNLLPFSLKKRVNLRFLYLILKIGGSSNENWFYEFGLS